MTPDDIATLIGRRYELGATGPDAYDCRGLLLHCQRTFFSMPIPSLPMGDDMRNLFNDRLASGLWEQVSSPRHGDAALLRGGDYPHVGVYLDCMGPGILHALDRVGVIWSPVSTLRLMGFSRTRYIRFNSA